MADGQGRARETIMIDDSDAIPIENEEIVQVVKDEKLDNLNIVRQMNNIVLVETLTFMVMVVVITHAIIHERHDLWAYIFEVMMLFELAKIFLAVCYLVIYNELVRRLIWFWTEWVLRLVTNFILILGIYLYFEWKIPAGYLSLFLLPRILLVFIGSNVIPQNEISGQRGMMFIDALQILLIFLNVAYFHSSHWTWITLYYHFIFAIMLVSAVSIGILVALFLIGFITSLFNGPNDLATEAKLVGTYIFAYVFIFVWLFTLAFFVLRSVVHLLSAGLMKPDQRTAPVNPELHSYAHAIFVLAIISIALLVIGYICVTIVWHRLTKGTGDKIYKVQEYMKKANLNYTLTSDTYFRANPPASEEKQPLVPRAGKLENCSVCFNNPSNVLIKPCGHTGYCKDCLLAWMKQNPHCPLCRSAIEKFYLVEFDEEKQKYMAKGRVIIK